ncbi:alpha/beta fold hydrolase [Kibdelosporangium aridum]|uniref:Alpha/beta hydrolase fold n=1 Tax=Kibdelosporangium aridum TaxID=2030 RepID=A0A1W2D9A3_KIBAR|nr:alpha/beta fold hydrolase [Kibdelosporangium aridum]SMC94005.1 alpha/beta hydrolase fold [Kibdelosporangium aridum]
MTVRTRKRLARTGMTVIAIAAALAGMTPAATAAQPGGVPAGLEEFYSQKPQWAPCADEGQLAALQCATLVVPLNYRQPGGERISVTISKMPAKDPAKRQGVLLVNPGGPGASGLGLPLAFPDRPIAQVYDLIGFDPRGVGRSTPLRCEVSPEVLNMSTRPTDGELAQWTAQARSDEADCERAAGGLRPYVNTPNTARDMDVIRGVLDEKKINYLGYSYGTYLGAVFGSLFPASLNRNVLDSSVHPEWLWREQFRQQSMAIRANVDEFYKWLGERDSVYGLGKSQAEVFATTEALAAKLATKPVTHPQVEGEVDRNAYDIIVGNYARWRAIWADLGQVIKEIKATSDGTLAAGSAKVADTVKAAMLLREFAIAQTRSGVFDTVTCEADWPRDLSLYYNDMKVFRDKYPFGLGVLRAAPTTCTFRSFTPTDQITDLKRAGYQTGLVIQADSDPQTQYDGGPAMAAKLNDQLISVVDEGSHGLYGANDCVSQIVDQYLVGGVLPGTRTTCPGEPRPDVPADNAGTDAQRPAASTNLTATVERFIAEKKRTNHII